MGVGASVEYVDKDQAKELAGDIWPGTARFEEVAEDGRLPMDRATAELDKLKAPGTESSDDEEEDDGPIDLTSPLVAHFLMFVRGSPAMSQNHVAENVEAAALSSEESEKIASRRRRRVRDAAEKFLQQCSELPEDERARAQNDGDLEMYSPENQAKREAIFQGHTVVNGLLDRWWRAATTYIDIDHSNTISKEEYREFHCRLLRILDDPDEMLSKEEEEEAFEEDFELDAGSDGAITQEEFRFSVFQLADHWTLSVDASEYVDFLKKGYTSVFADLIKADKLQAPQQWRMKLKGNKTLTKMPFDKVVGLISEVYAQKILADKTDDECGNSRASVGDFTLQMFENKFGTGKAFKKNFKSFVLGLITLSEDETHEFHSFGMLFAQLAGFACPSGRVLALPSTSADFVLGNIQKFEPLLNEARKKLWYKTESEHEKAVSDARTDRLICGYIHQKDGGRLLRRTLKHDLGIQRGHPLHKLAMISLEAITVTVSAEDSNDGVARRFIDSSSLIVLLGALSAAASAAPV